MEPGGSFVSILRGELRVHEDAEALARAGAAAFGRLAREAVAQRGRFSAVLTGGSSPIRLYELLADATVTGGVPWEAVHLFWGDERMVPPGHPRSNFRMAQHAFIGSVALPPSNVHRVRGELPLDRALAEMAGELAGHFGDGAPRFDLIHLGLGEDGHIASLFPFDRAILLEREQWVGRALLRALGEWRVTLTLAALQRGRRIEFLLPDPAKGPIARRAMRGPLDPIRIPAQAVRPLDGELIWRVTRDVTRAASLPDSTG